MLKVGDKVRIRENLKLGAFGVVPSMLASAGEETTITKITEFPWPTGTRYKLDVDNERFWWSENSFEPFTFETATETGHLGYNTERWIIDDDISAVQEAITAAQQELVDHCMDLLGAKRSDYATEDYFHTFNVAAELQDITPLQALGGMAAKHVSSVFKLINEHAEGREISRDMWMEKLGDVINYLLIAWAWLEVVDGKQKQK